MKKHINKLATIFVTMLLLVSQNISGVMVLAEALNDSDDAKTEENVQDTSETSVLQEDTAIQEEPNDADSAEVETITSNAEQEETKNEAIDDEELATSEPTDVKSNSPPEVSTEETSEATEEKSETKEKANISTQKDLGNIFTFESMKVNDEEVADESVIEISDGTIATIRYKWDTKGKEAKAGDTAEIQLPDFFKEVDIQRDLEVSGKKVGIYTIKDGTLKFEFDEGIEEADIENGWVEFGLEFDLEKFSEDVEQEIPFNDSKDNSISIIAKPSLDHSGITKEGHPDSEKNAKEINWSIDVINTNDKPITKAQLQDQLPEGLGEATDFVVHHLNVGINGDLTQGEVADIEANSFPVQLGDINPYSGYRITFTTPIEDKDKESFTNKAQFKYGEVSLPAEATVAGLTRSNPIQKEGKHVYDEKNNIDYIEWKIIVNENGQAIKNAIVKDEDLPAGVTLVPETIKITKNGEATDITAEKFPITIGEVAEDETYVITFRTQVDWSKVNEGDYQEKNGFVNKATLFDGDEELNDDDATVNIERDPMLRKEGVSKVDFENKTLEWTIHVNEAGHPIGNVVLTDLIPKGLSLSEGDIKIIDENGATYTPEDINLTPNAEDGKTAVKIDLGNVGTKILTITYVTTVTDFKINSFTNGVGINGVGIGKDGVWDKAEIKPAGNTFDKNFKGINYQEKTMDWRLYVATKREPIAELMIEDTFPNKGLILLPDTLEVRKNKTDSEPLVEGTDYTLEPRTEDGVTGYQKGFIIKFLEPQLPMNGEYYVDYQTSYDPQWEVEGNVLEPHKEAGSQDSVREYINHAHYTGKTVNGNTVDQKRKASQKIRIEAWNSGKKEGKLVSVDAEDKQVNGWTSGNERKVAWDFYFNYQKQNLGKGVVVTDTLAYEGEIDEDSVVVHKYTVDKEGKTKITDEVLDSSHYDLAVDGKTLTLTFNDDFEVNERYAISFLTSVPAISAGTYTNNATVKVGDKEYPYKGTVHYNEHDKFLNKEAVGTNGNQVFTGDEVDWQVKVNESLSTIDKDVTITDTISAGHVYKDGTLEIFKLVGGEEVPLAEGEDYTLIVIPNEETGTTDLEIVLTNKLENTLVLSYQTVVTETSGQIGNKITLEGNNIETKTVESERLNARQFSDAGGQWAANRGAFEVKKVDAETDEVIANNEASFTLWYELNGEWVQFGDNTYTTEEGVLRVGNLPLRTYRLIEVESPEGYVLTDGEYIEIDVDKPYEENEENVVKLDFENTKEKVEITGTKVWENGPKPSIALQLFRDGDALGEPVTLDGTEDEPWTYTWANLDKTDISGKAHVYTVDEVDVPDNYNKEKSEDGLTITNTFESPLTDISVEKIWEDSDNQDGIRPESIEVELLANGEKTEYDHLSLNDTNKWSGSFTDLPELDNEGKEITYSIGEVNVPEGYESVLSGNTEDGLTVTNSHTPEVIDLSGEKIWEDADNQDGVRPDEITINLLANGTEVDEQVVTAENNWSYEFTNLPKFEAGEEITYTVTEDEVPDYTTTVDGYDVTNSYTPDERSVTATKAWDDVNNQDGLREAVEVQLYANGEEHGEPVTLSAENNWTHTWTGLAVNETPGQSIEYTVEEVNVPDGYEVDVDDEDLGNVIITNSHTPELTEVSITKEWRDDEDIAGFRPDHIEVELYEDGNPTGKVIAITPDEDGNWEGSFINLPKYRDEGVAIDYTVAEVSLNEDLYSSKVVPGDKDEDGNVYDYTIVNTHEVDYLNFKGTKTWNDNDNQDGKRPETITVNLLADGERVASKEVTAADNWAYEFTDLPKFKDGQELNYTIQEDKVDDYSTKINGFDIINSYTPGKTSVNVVKTWDDMNDKDGIRPDEITIKLFANGKDTGKEIVLNAENNWQADFIDLDEYENGKLIDYSIEEVAVDGYTASIEATTANGFAVKNAHKPEEPSKPEEPGKPELPQTGQTSYVWIALALVFIGLAFYLFNKSSSDKKQ